eukprot:382021_1
MVYFTIYETEHQLVSLKLIMQSHVNDTDMNKCRKIINKLKQRLDEIITKPIYHKYTKYVVPETKLLHQLLIQNNHEIVATSINSKYRQSVLGFMLSHLSNISTLYFNDIVHTLLSKNPQLLSTETKLLYTAFTHALDIKSDFMPYLNTLDKIIKKCHISLSEIHDEHSNNPIHFIASSNAPLIGSLSYFCQTYPEW